MAEGPIFALDVGTRKIAGLVLTARNNKYHILEAVIIEHQQRAMLDGQIHDIPNVALAIEEVKIQLEKKLKFSLEKVSVAAAGRALRTLRATSEEHLTPGHEISKQDVMTLEAAAVQEAEEKLLLEGDQQQFYHCVGYSVVGYSLDDNPIGKLIGQRGQKMAAEIIATFLPRVVVDSLVTALQKSGLVMDSLTLEPIAASAVAVPPAMRGLNLVLVDVGAGTSDIAVTGKGSITGYAMVPLAGDEITEALSQVLLLDFNTAEQVKRQLNTSSQVTFTNVVGQKNTLRTGEIIDLLKPSVTELAREIANEILKINGKVPQAVLLIGGGSLTPGLPQALAGHLEIPAERVAVRGREVLHDVSGAKILEGPQAITPIGIAVTALKQEGLGQTQVVVNGRPVHFLAGLDMSVTQALLAAGIPAKHLYGKPGKGLGIEVNGRLTFLKGKPGQAGSIEVNGQKANLDTLLKPGDNITVSPGSTGEDACGTVGDFVPEITPKTIMLNGRKVTLDPEITMNGSRVNRRTPIVDQAKINYEPLDTVAQILAKFSLNRNVTVLLNGHPVTPDTPVKDGDTLTTEIKKESTDITITLNGQKSVIRSKSRNVMFADIFNCYDFPSTPPPGMKKLFMEINGRQAEFTTPLCDGDNVALRWDPE